MSILARSAISLGANALRGVVSFAVAALLARGLGPEDYGVFSFLLGTFAALCSLLDVGTSSAFATFTAQRKPSRRHVWYYLLWLHVQFLMVMAFVAGLAPDDWLRQIWHGESRSRIAVAFAAVFLQQQLWNAVVVLAESQRLTAKVQALSLAAAIGHLAVVSAAFYLAVLSVELVYSAIIVEYVLVLIAATRVLRLSFATGPEGPELPRRYWRYCRPLVLYVWSGAAVVFLDAWLLQRFGGAVEQAYFAVASQYASIALLGATALGRIFWKEVAEAAANGDFRVVERLHERTNRAVVACSAVISGFFVPWSSELVVAVFGSDYSGASLVLALMLLYPIHQSLSMVNSTSFHALSLTRSFTVIGLVRRALALVTTYLLLAPSDAPVPGLGLGSVGLTLKMLLLQFVAVNFSIWWLSRRHGWEFRWGYQIYWPLIQISSGFGAWHAADFLTGQEWPLALRTALAGSVYCVLTALVFYRFPVLLGLDREEFRSGAKRVVSLIFGRASR